MSKLELMDRLELTRQSADFAVTTLKKAGCVEQVPMANPYYTGKIGDKVTVPGYRATATEPYGLESSEQLEKRLSKASRLLEAHGYTVTPPK